MLIVPEISGQFFYTKPDYIVKVSPTFVPRLFILSEYPYIGNKAGP